MLYKTRDYKFDINELQHRLFIILSISKKGTSSATYLILGFGDLKIVPFFGLGSPSRI